MLGNSKLHYYNLYFPLVIILIFLVGNSCKSVKKSIKENKEVEKRLPMKGVFTDVRDGQIYNWVRLKDGNQWMAQNLNFEIADSWCYDNDSANCDKYGRLYTWESSKKSCPNEWRLPTDDEWWTMTNYYGTVNNFWDGQLNNESPDGGIGPYKTLIKDIHNIGFFALLGGIRSSNDDFQSMNSYGFYWTSTDNYNKTAWNYYFDSFLSRLSRDFAEKDNAFSCRCIKD